MAWLCDAAGWWLGYPELLVVGIAGLLALGVAGLCVVRSPAVEVFRDLAPERVARDDPAIAVLTCSRRGRRGWATMRAVDCFGPAESQVASTAGSRERASMVSVPLPTPRRGDSSTISYAVPTARRGDVAVGPLRLVATDPFGLLSRARPHGGQRILRVLPRTVPLDAAPSGRLRSPDGPGADRASGSVAFHTLRQYEFGDDLRQIHWRTTARTGDLMVRSLVDTSLPRTVVALDTRAGAYADPDDFELAVDVAASVALAAARPGFPLLVVCGEQVLVGAADSQAAPATVLDRLAGVRLSEDGGSPMAAVRAARGHGALALVTGRDAHELAGFTTASSDFDAVTIVRVGAPGPAIGARERGTLRVASLAEFAAEWQRRAAR